MQEGIKSGSDEQRNIWRFNDHDIAVLRQLAFPRAQTCLLGTGTCSSHLACPETRSPIARPRKLPSMASRTTTTPICKASHHQVWTADAQRPMRMQPLPGPSPHPGRHPLALSCLPRTTLALAYHRPMRVQRRRTCSSGSEARARRPSAWRCSWRVLSSATVASTLMHPVVLCPVGCCAPCAAHMPHCKYRAWFCWRLANCGRVLLADTD